jgi:hypothetical protein
VAARACGSIFDSAFDRLGKHAIGQARMGFVPSFAMNIETHMQDIDMPAKTQRDL